MVQDYDSVFWLLGGHARGMIPTNTRLQALVGAVLYAKIKLGLQAHLGYSPPTGQGVTLNLELLTDQRVNHLCGA